ncbi:putative HECT-domain-containing protein [Zalerion maritima]|uniref:HECT-type E3 ubiquitin transferase n=1 Tax=Zalerion maritima TaxID=339359 RepID=A0AAD5WT02_9PEZI|nr:putative HECT-domain-containing protein [Zalerion maritima]
MTREAPRSVEGQPHHFRRHNSYDDDALSCLWEEVPFAKLPHDAPKELVDFVVQVENPKHIYAIHRASRRHNFQLLVEKYVVQLRYGCNSPTCCTPTCFSFRRRLAGKTPIRRYNPTSARTLAAYLASKDNPENGLCPHLSPPRAPPAALNSLIFASKKPLSSKGKKHVEPSDSKKTPTQASVRNEKLHQTDQSEFKTPVNTKLNATPHARKIPLGELEEEKEVSPTGQPETPAFSIYERPVSKDYRSFAANVFGSVAFKMLEWLTPNGMAAMAERATEFQDDVKTKPRPAGPGLKPKVAEVKAPHTPSKPYHAPCDETPTRNHSRINRTESSARVVTDVGREPPTPLEPPRDPPVEWGSGLPPITKPAVSTHRPDRPGPQRQNSNARVRAASKSKPKKQMAIDTFPPSTDDMITGLRSPRIVPGSQPEKATKPFMTTTPSITRTLKQNASEDLFQRNTSLDTVVPPSRSDIPPVKEGIVCSSPSTGDELHDSAQSSQDTSETNAESVNAVSDVGSEILPQSLSKLNLEIVDLFCDILQEDGTAEEHMLEPPSIKRRSRRGRQGPKPLKRRSGSRRAQTSAMRQQWKLFIEQSLFHVLSDPYAIVNSFTTENGLLDSPTLWYCMLRITRVAPSLVFDSLWIAAASLFAPPKRLQSIRSPTSRFFHISERSLSSKGASNLLAVCLHALVAAVPLLSDSSALFDVSRLRSHGLSTDNTGPSSRQMTQLCLQYDDVFSDELALRLARRLFSAVSTRRGFQELVETDIDFDSDMPETDILQSILSQLSSIAEDPSETSTLIFSHSEYELHEKRVPTLLLDWARAVMLREWDGQPEVNAAGPFGGALELISAIFEKRHSFHIGDVDFRSEYFPDRLDSVEMPIAWLLDSSTRQRKHLLDYPYLFNPASLVSYFRAINFSRMNRSYEESSSLLSRMKHIMQQGSLISNEAHKQLLSEMLRTASLQYLILEIRRGDPLKDTFDQLWRREERELLRPLKVHLGEDSGEEGFDSGGVQQEFFRIAVARALDPGYGLFTVDDRTHMAWFRPGGLEAEWKYELVGLIFSLAVYNGLTLPITFPRALYRKLLGEPVTDIHHIADGWPDLANGLTTLLEWDENDGTVEDIFARTYEFSVETFGVHVSREMAWPSESASVGSKEPKWPQWHSSMAPPTTGNPADAPMVTGENRNAFVSDYIKYLTNVSVAPQFASFQRGFRTVIHPKSLSLLTSPLLQNLVEGIQTIDVPELRRYARYVGFEPSNKTIRDFWSIVKRYDERMKRKLLEFVTASDRVPVGGMKNLQFVIQKNGEQDDRGHLPTAYTCYGTLLLPEYRDKEVLKERLGMALQNAQGFGFA